jgi:hypothetical protein
MSVRQAFLCAMNTSTLACNAAARSPCLSGSSSVDAMLADQDGRDPPPTMDRPGVWVARKRGPEISRTPKSLWGLRSEAASFYYFTYLIGMCPHQTMMRFPETCSRHTWASHAVMNGMPLMVVGRNLGHADTRIVEKHYGHLAPSYVAEAVRAGAPKFGFKPDKKIARLV